MTDVWIKAGSYCPVCRGRALADCWHPAGVFRVQPAPSAEPVAWMCGDSATACEAARDNWTRHGFEVRPLYAAPPTDGAALRDTAIADLVRRKMTSGNSVPVERCIITAAEIEAIAQQEAP